MKRILVILAIALFVIADRTRECPAVQVWTGPKITFSKAASADTSLPENQDRITPSVWLTRESSRGLFNIAAESSYTNFSSPADTEWAFGDTGNIGSLTFTDWQTTISSNPPASVGEDMVVHLISDDIFIDIKFLTWGQSPSSGGFFSYERSTPIPEPATAALLLVGLAGLLNRKRVVW